MNNLDVESVITLDKFQLRDYQIPVWDAIENKGYRKAIVILPRRAGKDITLWNLAIRQCLRRVCLVHYVLPTYGQANRAIFSAISSSGDRFIDYIPGALVKSINTSEMKVVFKNNSVLQCVAGDTHNVSIRGTNPYMVILSEYAYMDADVYNTVSPILAGNGGIVIMASTPYGKNHFWQQYMIAKEMPNEWFVYKKTCEETQHIPEDDLEAERKRMSPELFAQEYMVSFERGVSGAVFGTCLDQIKKKNQITNIAYEPGLLVHCSIDIGVNDATTIIWFQTAGDGAVVRIIDCYSNNNLGLDHYVEILQKKPYWGRMGKFFAPHDLAVREWGGGAVTRYEKARQLGINFTILQQIDLEDSIENTMTHFPKFWIDQTNCRSLVNAIENYYREWDEKNQVYKRKPVHNWACFVAETPILTRAGMCQIINIQKDDEVLTLDGWKKCNKAQLMKQNAQLVEVIFQDGTKVKCTPDHKFLTVNGWKSAELLEKGTQIQSSLMKSPNILMGTSIGSMDPKYTSQRVVNSYTEQRGEMHSEIFPQDVIYTTKIPTALITVSGTLNACRPKSILKSINQVLGDLVRRLVTLRPNGMHPLKEDCGINVKQSDQKDGLNGKENPHHASIAEKNSNVSLGKAPFQIDKSSATSIARPLIIESVRPILETADVYCINVPLVHHFSLSNGAVVHNSNYADALRYMCQAIHLTSTTITSQDFDKKKMEAIMGIQPNLPYPFNQSSGGNRRRSGYL